MEDCNKMYSPIVPRRKLAKGEKGKVTDATLNKKMIGCLMYLLSTRPDITFFVCLAARYMESPIELHVAVVKRILRCLKGTLSFGIMYRCKIDGDLMMQGLADSDYAGYNDDRKRISMFSQWD